MMLAARLLSATPALAQGAPATPPPASDVAVPFAPPLDRNLLIEQSDDRLLPDGGRARFSEGLRLRFVRASGGLIASLTRIRVDCTGPDRYCAAFLGVMRPGVGTLRRFAVSDEGGITLLAGDVAVAGDDSSREVANVRAAQAQAPGDVSIAELYEALRYADHILPASRVALSASGIATVTDSEDLTSGDVHMLRETTTHIDSATGLITASDSKVWDGAAKTSLVSDRSCYGRRDFRFGVNRTCKRQSPKRHHENAFQIIGSNPVSIGTAIHLVARVR